MFEPHILRIRLWFAAGLLLIAIQGCGPLVLSVDDCVTKGDEPVTLTALVRRQHLLGLRSRVKHVPVSFSVDGNRVGQVESDGYGRASITTKLPATLPVSFDVRSTVGGRDIEAAGRIFRWDENRVIIVVDIDHTVAATDFDRLILRAEPTSFPPIPGAQETLAKLAERYYIMYLTARPRFLLEKTRIWLGRYNFPQGPVVTAPTLSIAARPTRFKRKTLAVWRRQWPNLLIGIGNRESDTEAYAPNEMLPLIVLSSPEDKHYVSDVVFANWNAAHEFFEADQNILSDPRKLTEAIQGKLLLPQPLIPWEVEKMYSRRGFLSSPQ